MSEAPPGLPAVRGRTTAPVATPPRAAGRSARAGAAAVRVLPVVGVLGLAAFLRLWELGRVGFNSDEAVYSGTAAAISGDGTMRSLFPVFRAHPVLFQTLLSVAFRGGVSDWTARAVAAGIGVLAVWVTYLLGARLYGRVAGLVAAAALATMPYHVVVSRQALLDGLMTLCLTLALYCVVRYSEESAPRWLIATGGAMGAAILSKETSVVLLGSLYAYFALTPRVRLRPRYLVGALAVMAAVAAAYPVTLAVAGRSRTGQHYLLWQLFRRPNHGVWFYPATLPAEVGIGVLLLAAAGLVWLRRESTWRERLLLAWVIVPFAFFTVWPVKGYQYLLPAAPVLAVLAGRTVSRLPAAGVLTGRVREAGAATVLVSAALLASLVVPTWHRVSPSASGVFLAGTGGVPGGREAGRWLGAHAPAGARSLAVGPSMANIVEFYSERRVYGLSVSPNPLNRNPSYTAVANPDRALRDGVFQYLIWDSYTASRSPSFSGKLLRLVARHRAVAVFTATVPVPTPDGPATKPVVIIYQVRVSP